ncbi:hypothetical protein MBLNU13_g11200t1 [Cladosporium sp. NU13]
MSGIEAVGLIAASIEVVGLAAAFTESIHCLRLTIGVIRCKKPRKTHKDPTDTQRLLEQAQYSPEQLEKQHPFDISEGKNHLDRHLARSFTAPEGLQRQWRCDQGNRGHSLGKQRALDVSFGILNGIFFSREFVIPEMLASKDCEIEVGRTEETTLKKLLSRIRFAGGRRLEDLDWIDGWTPQSSMHCKVSAVQAVRLAGGMFMLYPACMLVMRNYAVENGSFGERDSWVSGILQQPQDAYILQAHGAEGISMAQIVPGFVMEPSAPLFFVASMTWTFLEWAHYQSNVEDKYQMAILGVVSIIAFLPALGCAKDMLMVALCTVPWVMHWGLLVSDVLHRVSRVVQTRGGSHPQP